MRKSGIRLAILGATGTVGTEMLKVMDERNFPVQSLKLLADAGDAGKVISWRGRGIPRRGGDGRFVRGNRHHAGRGEQ